MERFARSSYRRPISPRFFVSFVIAIEPVLICIKDSDAIFVGAASGILPGQEINSEVRSRTSCRGDAWRDEERKDYLPQIVGLPRVKANEIAQRPLQEQKRNQRQCKPLGGSHSVANQPIKAAQEDRHIIPACHSGLAGWGGRDRTEENQIRTYPRLTALMCIKTHATKPVAADEPRRRSRGSG